jgi:hypothetical protein
MHAIVEDASTAWPAPRFGGSRSETVPEGLGLRFVQKRFKVSSLLVIYLN